MSLVKGRHELFPATFIRQLLPLHFCKVGSRVTVGDSRSYFHTRVGYRTNVCRRRLASDFGRASDTVFFRPHRVLEDYHDRVCPAPYTTGDSGLRVSPLPW